MSWEVGAEGWAFGEQEKNHQGMEGVRSEARMSGLSYRLEGWVSLPWGPHRNRTYHPSLVWKHALVMSETSRLGQSL